MSISGVGVIDSIATGTQNSLSLQPPRKEMLMYFEYYYRITVHVGKGNDISCNKDLTVSSDQ